MQLETNKWQIKRESPYKVNIALLWQFTPLFILCLILNRLKNNLLFMFVMLWTWSSFAVDSLGIILREQRYDIPSVKVLKPGNYKFSISRCHFHLTCFTVSSCEKIWAITSKDRRCATIQAIWWSCHHIYNSKSLNGRMTEITEQVSQMFYINFIKKM